MSNNYGYEYAPKVGGKYLTLKAKGDRAEIRIASTPLHRTIHWTTDDSGKPAQVNCLGEGCSFCENAAKTGDYRMAAKEVFGWIVLDRNDENKPKIFKGGTSIYLAVKGLSESKGWGDPQGYDIEVERTEEKPMYYRVTPQPNKSVITAEEKKAIEESNINLENELGGGEPTKTFGEDKGFGEEDEKMAEDLLDSEEK
jgi:hypothetical protein